MPISKELREFLTDWLGKQEGRLCHKALRWGKQQGFIDTYRLWFELADLFRVQFPENKSYPFDGGTAAENKLRRIAWVVKTLAE